VRGKKNKMIRILSLDYGRLHRDVSVLKAKALCMISGQIAWFQNDRPSIAPFA